MHKSRKPTSSYKKPYSRSKVSANDSGNTKDSKITGKSKTKKRSYRNSMRNLKSGKSKNKESVKAKKQLSVLGNDNRKQIKSKLNRTLGNYEISGQSGAIRKQVYKSRGMRAAQSGNKLGGLTYEKNKMVTSTLLYPHDQVDLYEVKRKGIKHIAQGQQDEKDWKKFGRLPVKRVNKKTNLYSTLDQKMKSLHEGESSKNSRLSVESNVKSKRSTRKKQDSLRQFQKNKKTNLTIYSKNDDVIGRKKGIMSQRSIPTSHSKIQMNTKPPSTRGRVKVGSIPTGSFHRKNHSYVGIESKILLGSEQQKKRESVKKKIIDHQFTNDQIHHDKKPIFYTNERMTAPVTTEALKLDILSGLPKKIQDIKPSYPPRRKGSKNFQNQSEIIKNNSALRNSGHQKNISNRKITKKTDNKVKNPMNSPTFNIKKILNPKSEEILDHMMNKNISKNIQANLRTKKNSLDEISPSKKQLHKYSKTYTNIEEVPGVFTFINNQVSLDYSNKERSLSPHSGHNSKFNSDINNNIFFKMKPGTEEEVKMKQYLSMKNLSPQLQGSQNLSSTITPVQEVRESMEFQKEHFLSKPKKDNIFFEEFSENQSKKDKDSNSMSISSFKKKKSGGREKELTFDYKSTFSKSYNEFSNSNNIPINEEPQNDKRKIYSHKQINNSEEIKIDFLKTNLSDSSTKKKPFSRPKRTSILEDDIKKKNINPEQPHGFEKVGQGRASRELVKDPENIKLLNNAKGTITFNELKPKNTNSTNYLRHSRQSSRISNRESSMIEFESSPLDLVASKGSFEGLSSRNPNKGPKDDMKTIFIVDESEKDLTKRTNEKKVNTSKIEKIENKKNKFPMYSNEPSKVPLNSLNNSIENNRLFQNKNFKNNSVNSKILKYQKDEEGLSRHRSSKKSVQKKDEKQSWKNEFKKQISKNLAKYQANQRSISSISSYKKFAKNPLNTSIGKTLKTSKTEILTSDQNTELSQPSLEESSRVKIDLIKSTKMNRSFEREGLDRKMQEELQDRYSKSQVHHEDTLKPPINNIYNKFSFSTNVGFNIPVAKKKSILIEDSRNNQSFGTVDNLIGVDKVSEDLDGSSKGEYYNVYGEENDKNIEKKSEEKSKEEISEENSKQFLESIQIENPKLLNSLSFTENQFITEKNKNILLSDVKTNEKIKDSLAANNEFINIFDMKEVEFKEKTERKEKKLNNEQSEKEASIVSSIRSIPRVESKKILNQKNKSNKKKLGPHFSNKKKSSKKKESIRMKNKSHYVRRVNEFLNEKDENTIRKAKNSTQNRIKSLKIKIDDTFSKKEGSQINEKILKMILERQKEYRGKLENLEKKTESSHQMLEELLNVGDSIKGSLDRVIQNKPEDVHPNLINLEFILEKFERLSTDLKEAQVLQKYWLDNLKHSSSKLESAVLGEINGTLSRISDYLRNPMSVTSRTFQSYADPLNSESNSLFQKKMVGQHDHPGSKHYSIMPGSHRFYRNYKKSPSHRLSQENNKIQKESRTQIYGQVFPETSAFNQNDHFVRRDTVQTHEIQSNTLNKLPNNSGETMPAKRQPYYKSNSRQNLEEQKETSQDTQQTRKQNADQVILQRLKDNQAKMTQKPEISQKSSKQKVSIRPQSNYFASEPDKYAERGEIKKSQSNQYIKTKDGGMGQINIYHLSKKQKGPGKPNNKSLPYLHSRNFSGRYQPNEPKQYLEEKQFTKEQENVPYSLEFKLQENHRNPSNPPPPSPHLQMIDFETQNMPRSPEKEDFVIEPIIQSKKSLKLKTPNMSSREEIIQLNQEFIKKKLGQKMIPSELLVNEVSETESRYETNTPNYETNSTNQSDEAPQPANVIVNRPVSPLLSSWEPKIDYTQGHPMGNIIYNPHNPHMIPAQSTASSNYHMFTSNHSVPGQYQFYNNSNLYQKQNIIPAYESNYNHSFNHHPQMPMQGNYQPMPPKNKRRKKKKKKMYYSGEHTKFDQLNKLNQKILKKKARRKKNSSNSQVYENTVNQVHGNMQNMSNMGPMMNYPNQGDHHPDPHYNSRYYYSKHEINPHSNF